MELLFPNYMIIILYGLNPKRIGLQASAGPGRIQEYIVTVMSCDPFNQRALHAGMLWFQLLQFLLQLVSIRL